MNGLPKRHAVGLVSRVPHHDIDADSDDALQDCAVWLLERQARGDLGEIADFPSFLAASLRNYMRWFAARVYTHQTRHYGWRTVNGGQHLPIFDTYPDGHETPAYAWGALVGARAGTDRGAAMHLLVVAVGRACARWSGPAWVPWAWVLVHCADVPRKQVARWAGVSPQRIGQLLNGECGARGRWSFVELVRSELQ